MAVLQPLLQAELVKDVAADGDDLEIFGDGIEIFVANGADGVAEWSAAAAAVFAGIDGHDLT